MTLWVGLDYRLVQRLHQTYAASYNENPIIVQEDTEKRMRTGTSATYRVEHPSLVEVICDRHHILIEVIELHFGKTEHHVTQFGTIVYLPL
jgi:hypothetical protein